MAYKIADMTLFSRVEGGQVIIAERGLYRQVDLYKQDGRLYAALKDSFVRLYGGYSTTAKHIRWVTIDGVDCVATYDGVRIASEIQSKAKAKRKPKLAA